MVVEQLMLEKSRLVVQVREDGNYSVGSQGLEAIWRDPMDKGAVIGIGQHTPGMWKENRGGSCTASPTPRPTSPFGSRMDRT
ncbi:hypothetical protein GCM10020255_101790 [Rhodococcus baikonurensis]